MRVTTQLKNTMKQLESVALQAAAEAILSLPLALVVMVAGLLLLAPVVLKGVPSTWTQTLAQIHAAFLWVPFGTIVYKLAEMLRAVFLVAWLVALLARRVIRFPDPAIHEVDKAYSGRDTSKRLADASSKPQG